MFEFTIQILSELYFLIFDGNATSFIKSELASECRGNQEYRFNATGFLLSSRSATQNLAYDSWWLLFTRLNQHCDARLLDLKSRCPANHCRFLNYLEIEHYKADNWIAIISDCIFQTWVDSRFYATQRLNSNQSSIAVRYLLAVVWDLFDGNLTLFTDPEHSEPQ